MHIFENFFLKVFGGLQKSCTFASAFALKTRRAHKEEFFERFT
jgi:hypothetical protein